MSDRDYERMRKGSSSGLLIVLSSIESNFSTDQCRSEKWLPRQQRTIKLMLTVHSNRKIIGLLQKIIRIHTMYGDLKYGRKKFIYRERNKAIIK